MANPPGYVQYRKSLSVPPDVVGARAGFRPGYGYYVKTPGMPPPPGVAKKPAVRKAQAPRATVDPLTALVTSQISSLLGPGALQTSAHQNAADAMKLELDTIRAANADQKAELEQRSERASGFAQALAKLTSPDAGQITDLYRGAADRLRGYGTGLTGDVAAAQQADAAQANQGINTVLGGLGTGVQGYDPNAIRNAAQMAGVVIPGTSLVSRAVDAAKQAMYDRAAHAQTVEDISTGYQQQETGLDTALKQRATELAAQSPALYRQQLQDLQQAQTQKVATIISAMALGNTQMNTASEAAYRQALAKASGVRAKATAKASAAGKPLQHTNVGSHPVSFDPDTGIYYDPVSGKPITQAQITQWQKEKKKGGGAGGSKGLQSKTINGNTVVYDPNTGTYYLPGDTKNPVDPNTLKPKQTLKPGELQQFRAQARGGVTGYLTNHPKATPQEIYTYGVGEKGIPGWVMVWALKQEAVNYPDSKPWQNVLKPHWAGGPTK